MNKDIETMNEILNIDRVIHEPARLLILKYLMILEYCDFVFLMKSTSLTKGNLSSHIRKLEESGYVVVEKAIINRKSNTVFKITPKGILEFNKYEKELKDFLNQS